MSLTTLTAELATPPTSTTTTTGYFRYPLNDQTLRHLPNDNKRVAH